MKIATTTTASIYYGRANWQNLLRFIHPYLLKAKRYGILDDYYVQFSRHRGDHIRLITKSSTEQGYTNSQGILYKVISKFIHNNPSENKAQIFPVKGFFMDYPNNSVWINHNRVHNQENAAQSKEQIGMQMQISAAFIAAFEQEEMTLENICTFVVYLQLGMLKAFNPTIQQASMAATELLNWEKKQSTSADDDRIDQTDAGDFFQQMLEENHSSLVDIILETWELEGLTNPLQWTKTWEKACGKFIGNSDYPNGFFDICGMIYGQINFISVLSLPLISLKLIAKILSDMKHTALKVHQ